MADETDRVDAPAEPGGAPPTATVAAARKRAEAGDTAGAWAILEQRLAAAPADAASLKLMVWLADRQGRYTAPLPWLDAAIPASAPDWATYWRYRGAYLARRAGAAERAMGYVQAVLEADPAAAAAYNEMALIQHDRGDTDSALAWLAKGEEAAPGHAALAYNRGRILGGRRDLAGEAACYRRAVACEPGHADAQFALIRTLERLNDLAGARQAQAAAEAALGASPKLTATAARLALRAQDLDAARDHLAALDWQRLDADSYRDTLFLAGQVYDRLGEPDRALAHFSAGNASLAATELAQRYEKRTALAQLDRLKTAFRPERVADWPAPQPGTADAATPVFLVGFPRSGTTLLEVALGSHPAITVLEEQPIVAQLTSALAEQPHGYPEALFHLQPRHCAQLRELYFKARAQFLEAGDNRLVVDKLPMNIQHAGLLYRLFPEARFIFALRHPADAVLSGFMQSFTPNASMNNFYSLADATAFYDRVMAVWQHYLALLPLRVATVPYEALIADFERVTGHVLAALGLPWDDAVARYRERAAGGGVYTPSYAQVSQPLYSRARYRWQRYAPWLADQLPTLRAWAAWFGYREADDGTIQAPACRTR